MTAPASAKKYRYGFVLVEDFSMLAMTSAVEVMRMANYLLGRTVYEWYTITPDGQPARASDNIMIAADLDFRQDVSDFDGLIVCSGVRVEKHCQPILLSWLREQEKKGIPLGALCTGAFVLGEAGLLDGYRCTIHWEYMTTFCERFPNVFTDLKLFSFDRDRFTCAGGTAPLDMMLNIVRKQFSHELSAAIGEEFMSERIRTESDLQRIPLRTYLGPSHSKLMEIVSLMEANLEEPISLDELALYVNMSRRQLERQFQKHLNCTPSRYYLKLRLVRARKLLTQTNMSITDIGIACGFVSTPHFSKCYREYFGIPPRNERVTPHTQAPFMSIQGATFSA